MSVSVLKGEVAQSAELIERLNDLTNRKTHDRKIRALNAPNQRRADILNPVRTGFIHGLTGGDIARNHRRAKLAKFDPRAHRFDPRATTGALQPAKSRLNGMRTPRQAREHRRGLPGIGGFLKHDLAPLFIVDDHDGVGRKNPVEFLVAARQVIAHRLGLRKRQPTGIITRRLKGGALLGHRTDPNPGQKAQIRHQLQAPWRAAGKDKPALGIGKRVGRDIMRIRVVAGLRHRPVGVKKTSALARQIIAQTVGLDRHRVKIPAQFIMTTAYKNPTPTVDTIIEIDGGIVLISRKNEPLGWALPGGFVDEGESVEHAAWRETLEETGLEVELTQLFYTYSDPRRDPRQHTMSTVFIGTARGTPEPHDDAADARIFKLDALPLNIVFDHARILAHYREYLRSGMRPSPALELQRFLKRSGVIGLGLMLLSLAMPVPAQAQTPPARAPASAQPEDAGIRFQKSFALIRDNSKTQDDAAERLKLTLRQQTAAPDARNAERIEWSVSINTESGAKNILMQDSFPAWATLAHYGYELESKYLGNDIFIVLLSALPGINANASPDSAQFQMAWVRDGRKWRRVGSAKYSMLDGGSQFRIISPVRNPRLIRRRPNANSNFCGADTVESKYSPIVDLYHPQSDKFINHVDFDALLKDAKYLKARPADNNFNPPFLRTWSQWFAASSDRRSRDREGATIRPLELGDGKFDTAWMEGAEGLGRGEFVSTQINDAVGLSSVRIITGLGTSEDTLAAFARPTKILLALSDGSRFIVELQHVDLESVRAGHGVMVELPRPVKTNCLSVMLLESTPGTPLRSQPEWARETVAISQITPYSSLHFANAEQTARQIVEQIALEPDARTRGLIAQMAIALKTPLSDEVRRAARAATPVERKRIIALIGSLPSEQAAKLLTDFLRETDPGSPEYRTLKRGLASLQHHASPGLIEYLRENSIESPQKRVDLLRLIGRVAPPDQLVQLLAQLGQGTMAERNERIRALSAGKQAMVEPLLVHASEHPGLAGGYDAIQALNLLGHRLHYKDQGELPRPELYKQILAAADSRRTRLRVLEVAKYFHVQGFLDFIQPDYIANKDPLTRKSTLQALSRDPSPEARDLIIAALKDTSPDVRIAAIDALAERNDLPDDLQAVIDYSKVERWKPGLQKAFKILAQSEAPGPKQRFIALFEQDPNSDTALLAARALRRAEGHLDAQVAENIIRDTIINDALRLEMFNLLGLDSSESGEDFLLGVFNRQEWEKFFEDPKTQHIARQHVFMTLGRRRNLEARAKMLELSADATAPEVQQISLRALGFYKDAELLEALEKQKESATPETQALIAQTITMIQRRRALDDIQEDLGNIAEDVFEERDNDPSDTGAE